MLYLIPIGHQFFDNNGLVVLGGKVYCYQAGTTTPQSVYADSTGVVPLTNPVVLDSAGRATCYVNAGDGYRFVLTTAIDVPIRTWDNIVVPEPETPAVVQVVPTGAMLPWLGPSAPTGYLLADGSAYSRVTYATLFAICGTAYGVGDGSTTFNLPDMRGRYPMGVATSGTGNTRGARFGAIDHTHSVATQAVHSHGTDSKTVAGGGHDHGAATGDDGAHDHTGSTDSGSLGVAQFVITDGGFTTITCFFEENGEHVHGITTENNHSHTITAAPTHQHDITDGGSHAHGGLTGTQNAPTVTCNWIVKT